MDRRSFLRGVAAVPAAAAAAKTAAGPKAAPPADIALTKPKLDGGRPLMLALSQRKTVRNLTAQKLTPEQLSGLLWAACGINRPDKRRTAPTAMNFQDLGIYVFLEEGVYLYDAEKHALTGVVSGDQRAKISNQAGIAKSPVCLVYFSDQEKLRGPGGSDPNRLLAWGNVHAGFVGQNVYLYAASEGLGSCFRAALDPAALTPLLALRPSQKLLYTQTVGVPA